MNSSQKSRENVSKEETIKNKGSRPTSEYDDDTEDHDKWEEWYDDNEFQNKKNKIRRSKKRLYKQVNEW